MRLQRREALKQQQSVQKHKKEPNIAILPEKNENENDCIYLKNFVQQNSVKSG